MFLISTSSNPIMFNGWSYISGMACSSHQNNTLYQSMRRASLVSPILFRSIQVDEGIHVKCVYRATGFVGISTTIKSKGSGSVYHFSRTNYI
jgi:hypothetical protein